MITRDHVLAALADVTPDGRQQSSWQKLQSLRHVLFQHAVSQWPDTYSRNVPVAKRVTFPSQPQLLSGEGSGGGGSSSSTGEIEEVILMTPSPHSEMVEPSSFRLVALRAFKEKLGLQPIPTVDRLTAAVVDACGGRSIVRGCRKAMWLVEPSLLRDAVDTGNVEPVARFLTAARAPARQQDSRQKKRVRPGDENDDDDDRW